MAKTVAEKLLIKPGSAVFVAADDAAQRALLDPLPEGATEVDAAQDSDVAVLFAVDRAAMDEKLADHLSQLESARARWVAYRKGGRSDINRDSIWARFQELGWQLNANVSISDEWSAVRMKPAV